MRPLVRRLFVYAAFSQTAFVDAAFSQMAFLTVANMQGNHSKKLIKLKFYGKIRGTLKLNCGFFAWNCVI